MRFWPRKKKQFAWLTMHEHNAMVDRRSDDQKLLDWLAELPTNKARTIRQDAGWTQKEVAEACKVTSASLVGKWERGSGWSKHSGVLYARLLKELEAMRDDSLVHERSPI